MHSKFYMANVLKQNQRKINSWVVYWAYVALYIVNSWTGKLFVIYKKITKSKKLFIGDPYQ